MSTRARHDRGSIIKKRNVPIQKIYPFVRHEQ